MQNCIKCGRELHKFVNLSALEAYECVDCRIVISVLYKPSRGTSKIFTELVDSVSDKSKKKVLDLGNESGIIKKQRKER